MNVVNLTIEKWKRAGISLFPPNDKSTVVAALDKTRRKYSRDVIELYCTTGGMVEDDSRFWSMWSLDKIVSENANYNRPYILFADFLIESHYYCFKFENEEISSVLLEYFDGIAPKLIANTVQEFFKLYHESPASLNIFDD